MSKNIFIFSLILVFFFNISYFELELGPTYIGWIENATYLIALPVLLLSTYNKRNNVEQLYIMIMLLGLFFHVFLPEKGKFPISDAIQWIFLIVIIIASRKYKTPRLIFYLFVIFFIIHCTLAIIEYKLQTNLFDYSFVKDFSNFSETKEFRAFGLMKQPLQSSNITLIIMSFIMVSKDINWNLKLALLTLGTLAMFCFNSRIGIIILGCLLVYRYLFYNLKPIFIITICSLIYIFFINDFISFVVQNSQIFGRLAEKDNLTDDSSLARILSYVYFWNARWNLQDIMLGGREIHLQGSELTLENGILLTISWWGWVVGIAKVILELVISYIFINKYNIKDKVILLIACWGTAFANNNSFYTFVFVFFIISFLSISSIENRKDNNKFKDIK